MCALSLTDGFKVGLGLHLSRLWRAGGMLWREEQLETSVRGGTEGEAAKVKGKVYKMAMRPAMMSGLMIVALIKRQKAELEMLRFSVAGTNITKETERLLF